LKVGQSCLWQTTKAFNADSSNVGSVDSRVRLAKEMVVGKDECCTAGTWVAWTDEHAMYRIGRVADIIQFVGSEAARSGRADYVLLTKARVGHRHGVYQMPQVTLLEDQVLVQPKVSVQTYLKT
jgi:hypothetical protein